MLCGGVICAAILPVGSNIEALCRQVLETIVQAGILPPKRLHGGADDHLSGWAVGGAPASRVAARGQHRGRLKRRQTTHGCQKRSSVHLLSHSKVSFSG